MRDARVPPGRCAPDEVSCRVSRSLESDAHSSGMTQHDVNDHTRLERDQTVATERRVWTVGEAALVLGISRAHAYELVARGELPHLLLGRRIVIPCHALEVLLTTSVQVWPRMTAPRTSAASAWRVGVTWL